MSLSCCRRFPGLGRRWRRSSSQRPAPTCPGSPPPRTWLPGPGWRRRCTSPPAKRPRPASGTDKWLTAMLVEAAGSVGRMKGKNHLSARHAQLTRRRGRGRAQVAVAHSILVSAYWMLKRDEPYHDLGADWHSRRNNEAHTRRLIAQLERLGHTVILKPAA